MQSFAGFLKDSNSFDYVAIIGEGLGLVTRHFRNTVRRDRLLPLAGTTPELVIAELLKHISCHDLTIIGMGNEKGAGLLMSRFFRGV
jgi:hypothetical protein